MTQAELLGFIIERKGTITTAEVANHFGIPVFFAHQVLRRLKDKGILATNEQPYRLTWWLSEPAQRELQTLRSDRKSYGWTFLLGLGVGLLIGFASSKKDENTNRSTTGKKPERDQ